MGDKFEAKCNDCGHVFSVSDGGGFTFHLLRCNQCGETKTVLFEEIADLHFRYLKGLPGPYSVVTSERDEWIKEDYDGEPISESEYYRGVEEFAGRCHCKGEYKIEAPPRCPKCHSSNIEGGESFESFD
jgi:Zn finger protein HypA/HybF involved in hydrogenase expression